VRGRAQLLARVRQLHEIDLGRALEAPEVIHQPEHGRTAIRRVGADALGVAVRGADGGLVGDVELVQRLLRLLDVRFVGAASHDDADQRHEGPPR